MPRLRLVVDVINHYEELIELASQVNQCEQYWKSFLSATEVASVCNNVWFVVKFIVQRGLAFRDDENIGSPRNIFQKMFQNFVQVKFQKKLRCFSVADAGIF